MYEFLNESEPANYKKQLLIWQLVLVLLSAVNYTVKLIIIDKGLTGKTDTHYIILIAVESSEVVMLLILLVLNITLFTAFLRLLRQKHQF